MNSKKQQLLIGTGTTILIIFLFLGMSAFVKSNTEPSSRNYDGRVFYELFVRSFYDSNGDGIGDLNGVTQKLDYLEGLGIKGIWLMPITKATSYHGYDTEDYYSIDEDYGTMEDLEKLIKEAHKRDIKVVMDLVINHTSVNHPWFVEAKRNKESKFRDYYIWTDDVSKMLETSPMGHTAWAKNPERTELYYALFWEGMPDLNFENPAVEEEIHNIAKCYLDKGIDGFRLDAAKWIFLEQEKNIAFWERFRTYVRSINQEAILVGEVWDKPQNMVPYTASLDSFFEFEGGENLLENIHSGTLAGATYKYIRNYKLYKERTADFSPSLFLTNHDQNRAMSTLSNDLDKMKQAAVMYLTLPGTPYIYYGEEIGMQGVKPDERIREPFVWNNKDLSQNTNWINSTNQIDKIALNLQKEDEKSLYNTYKNIIHLRNSYKALRYGEMEEVQASSREIYGMKRSYEDQAIYILINGGNEAIETPIESGSYSVLYTEQKQTFLRDETIEVKKNLLLQPKEVLILLQKKR